MLLTLFTTPGSCSLAVHLALESSKLAYQVNHVDLRAKKLEDGSDYLQINPKGAVPALLIDGELLTENAVLLTYVADHAPSSGLLPQSGMERYRTLEWTNYVATELHKGFSPLFNPSITAAAKEAQIGMLIKKFGVVDQALDGKQYLTRDAFQICDAYLFTILRWSTIFEIDLSDFPALVSYMARIRNLPHVSAVFDREGLRS